VTRASPVADLRHGARQLCVAGFAGIAALWVLSAWRPVELRGSRWSLSVRAGQAMVNVYWLRGVDALGPAEAARYRASLSAAVHASGPPEAPRGLWSLVPMFSTVVQRLRGPPSNLALKVLAGGVALWIPMALCAVVFVAMRPRRSAGRPPLCRNCNYDLTGNVSGRCPECGTPIGEKRA
jgi:hypothetical protein